MKLDELVAGSTKSKDGAACKELHEDAGSGRLIECGRKIDENGVRLPWKAEILTTIP